MNDGADALGPRGLLLYHFCRMQLPALDLSQEVAARHLQRTFSLYRGKAGSAATLETYLDNLYPLDWFLASACLEGKPKAWEILFASRAGRSDCLLLDALRARAARLYPRNEESQESAVNEFWGHLFAPESEGSLPILARYDGNRPLVPWLIRVFQNWHISLLRRHSGVQALPDDDIALPLPAETDSRWRETFARATTAWLSGLDDDEILLLGLRLRHRLSQREVAHLLGVHEGTISRRTDTLRDQCLEFLGKRLVEAGWTGDDLAGFIQAEMLSLLIDDPHLSVDNLASLMARKKLTLPVG
jgi:RNA polymerase sigma factor (sigma-70 family)